jgi:hypothetical protein
MSYRFKIGWLCIILILSCEKIDLIQDNPLDPDNPDYVPPSVTLISAPTEGETINVYDISFSWTGNENVTDYRWKFEDGEWVDWTNITYVDWNYLDEGNHSFSLQSRYITGDTSTVLIRNFIVDAVEGPALMFYPRAHIVSSDTVVIFQILAEEVTNLSGVQFKIDYDSNELQVLSITQGPMLQISGQTIFDVDYDNTNGTILVITAALGGDQPSVSGTDALLTIEIQVNTGSTTILEFDGTELFRDPNNNDIPISEIVNGLIKSL